MRKRVEANSFFAFVIYIFIIIILLPVLDRIKGISYYNWLSIVNVLIIGLFIIQITIGRIVFKRFITLSSILLVLTYIFNLSFPFVLQYGGIYAAQVQYKIRNFSSEVFQSMVTYAIQYIAILFGGMLFYSIFTNKKIEKHKNDTNEIDTIYFRNIGKVMFCIALPVDLVLLVIRLFAALKGGYVEAFTTASTAKYYATFASYLLLASVFLLWSTTDDSTSKRWLISYCLYEVVWMFTGQRATPMICIIIAFWLYYQQREKHNIKSIIKVCVVGFILLIILNIIREFRAVGYSSISISDILGISVLFDTMTEFGVTINIFGYVLNYTGEHNIGFGLLYDILFVIPKISWLNLDTTKYDIYSVLNLSTAGSSYLAEILFDFKNYGGIVVFIYGMYVRWLDLKMEYLLSNNELDKLIYYIPLAVITVFCVRTGTNNILRTFVWSALLIFIIKSILVRARRGSNE